MGSYVPFLHFSTSRLFAMTYKSNIQPKTRMNQFLHQFQINSDFQYLLHHLKMVLLMQDLDHHKSIQQNYLKLEQLLQIIQFSKSPPNGKEILLHVSNHVLTHE